MKPTRRLIQFAFLSATLIGVYVFGANCERWCPFGGVEAIYTYASEGNMICSLGVSNFYILGGVLLMTLLLRRAFCGYVCPLGTISEWLRLAAGKLGVGEVRVNGRLDRALSLLKYVVLAIILVTTWRAGELLFRAYDPCYALISRHGEDITAWAYVVAGLIVVASLVIVLPFCRWFCPLAAVLNLFSRFGLTRVSRDGNDCSDCGLCAKACPMNIPVDQLEQVTAARCTSCMSCIEACPQKSSGTLGWGPPASWGRRWSQAVLIAVLLACTGGAIAASYLAPLPSFIKTSGILPDRPLATARLKIDDVRCRGRANLLFYFLQRDDLDRISGYFKLEAWPGPGAVDVHVTYDPAVTDEETIKRAITSPYYDAVADFWRDSPFTIEGYDPLGPSAVGPEL